MNLLPLVLVVFILLALPPSTGLNVVLLACSCLFCETLPWIFCALTTGTMERCDASDAGYTDGDGVGSQGQPTAFVPSSVKYKRPGARNAFEAGGNSGDSWHHSAPAKEHATGCSQGKAGGGGGG